MYLEYKKNLLQRKKDYIYYVYKTKSEFCWISFFTAPEISHTILKILISIHVFGNLE